MHASVPIATNQPTMLCTRAPPPPRCERQLAWAIGLRRTPANRARVQQLFFPPTRAPTLPSSSPSPAALRARARFSTTSRPRRSDDPTTPTTTSSSSSSPAAAAAANLPPPPPPPSATVPPSPPPPKPRRRRRGLYCAVLFLALGAGAGGLFRLTFAPPALPAAQSPEDLYLAARIRAAGCAHPVVRALSASPGWTSWDAYGGLASPATSRRLTSGPLGSSSGLAFQRVFANPRTGEVVAVVFLGPGTAGWPGVVHGGALATLLDECLGRCALRRFPSRTGVTARLELRYRAPTRTGAFYVVRTRPEEEEEDQEEQAGAADGERNKKKSSSDRKMWVKGTLETDDGQVCVEARALFVVPKGFQLAPIVDDF
ncbi:HotDog domain-containing protein [Xylariomycetidae sp. FL0641]|nr:HotDog domain-containing protein [Xylariomycetidae sp. FL0641]